MEGFISLSVLRGQAAKAVKAPRGWENQGLSSCSLCLWTPPPTKKIPLLKKVKRAITIVKIVARILSGSAMDRSDRVSSYRSLVGKVDPIPLHLYQYNMRDPMREYFLTEI